MSSQPDPDIILDRYMDNVCAQLDFLPSYEVERNRTELRQHLEAAVDEHVASGLDRNRNVFRGVSRA